MIEDYPEDLSRSRTTLPRRRMFEPATVGTVQRLHSQKQPARDADLGWRLMR